VKSYLSFYWGVFPPRDRRRLVLVLVMALVAAVFETVGVASIVPFMGMVLDNTMVQRTPVLQSIVQLFGAETPTQQLRVMGLLTLLAIILGNATSAFSLYCQQRFVARARRQLSTELFSAYMTSPYAFHVRRDTPALLKVIYEDLESTINVIGQALILLSRCLILVALTTLLIVRNPLIALATIVLLGGSYVIAYRLSRRRQRVLGENISQAYDERGRMAQEGLSGIKELIILGRTGESVRRFKEAMGIIADASAESGTAAAMPRYFLESIAYGGLVIVTLMMISREGGVTSTIPTLSLFAFTAYRLMPSLQQLFQAALTIRFSQAAMDATIAEWPQVKHLAAPAAKRVARAAVGVPQAPPPTVALHDVSFGYEGAGRMALQHVSLDIKPGESIGIVGRTGSGKTTLVDVVLGLYTPAEGYLTVDGKRLSGDAIGEFQRRIGYVPQQVFLGNATIAENIAFGVPPEEIDHEAVKHAAVLAQAEEFIGKLPERFNTVVGERGVRLSGGQRQRLGIARALYHQPSILVFDEATSALDGLTESALMKAIRQLAGEHTVILIAHRLKTVEACDRIVMMDSGRVLGIGSWEDLLTTNRDFANLVGGPAVGAVA
jgi:ABC-type multidrug transport system fused ATPase/permease subunit